MKKILLIGWYGSSNIGDDAILEGILTGLRKKDNSLDIAVCSSTPELTSRTYAVKSLYLWKKAKGFMGFLKALKNCDTFILGGGSLIQDTSSFLNLLHWLTKIYLGILFGKKVYVLAIGADIKTKLGRFLTRAVLSKTRMITTRDRAAKDMLVRLGIEEKKIVSLADPANLIVPSPKETGIKLLGKVGLRTGTNFAVINVRQLFRRRSLMDFGKRKWERRGRERFHGVTSGIAAFLDTLALRYGVSLLFVPFQICPADNDLLAIEEVIAKMKNKNAYVLRETYRPADIMSLIGMAKVVISMRFHPLIFAAKMHVPMLGISYAPKTEGFMEDIGAGEFVVNVDRINKNEMLLKADKLFREYENIKKLLKDRSAEIYEKALENFTYCS